MAACVLYETGVYKIENKVTGDCYIGSAASVGKWKSTSGFNKRWKKHESDLTKNKHCNKHLQNAWNKYGKENFSFSILTICPKECCVLTEQVFIDIFNPSYNIQKVAGSSNLGIKFSEEHRLKMSKAQKGRVVTWGGKISQSNSLANNPERGRSISKALTGLKRTEEARINNRDKRRLHTSIAKLTVEKVKEIKKMTLDGKTKIECAKLFGVSRRTINQICLGKAWSDVII